MSRVLRNRRLRSAKDTFDLLPSFSRPMNACPIQGFDGFQQLPQTSSQMIQLHDAYAIPWLIGKRCQFRRFNVMSADEISKKPYSPARLDAKFFQVKCDSPAINQPFGQVRVVG